MSKNDVFVDLVISGSNKVGEDYLFCHVKCKHFESTKTTKVLIELQITFMGLTELVSNFFDMHDIKAQNIYGLVFCMPRISRCDSSERVHTIFGSIVKCLQSEMYKCKILNILKKV